MSSPLSKPLCLIIPCYNEEKRLDLKAYSQSLDQKPEVSILFVDDGSKDKTLKLITELQHDFPQRVEYISLPQNQGKAEAVRAGMLHAIKTKEEAQVLGYIDADLATSIDEAASLTRFFSRNDNYHMIFGSRVLMVGTEISRKWHRHYIGRIVATLISRVLHLQVYDTQCGAKIFRRGLADFVFQEPFLSKWLFDVEIFARILCKNETFGQKVMKEVPLRRWVDKGQSKVSALYGFRLLYDLGRIALKYPLRQARLKRSE